MEIEVDGSVFVFPEGWDVSKYDEWPFYRKRLSRLGGVLKPKGSADGRAPHGCDVVALCKGDQGGELWLIEAKDYTYHGAVPPRDLIRRVCEKVFDTIAGLHAGTYSDHDQREWCRRAVRAGSLRVALHIDVPEAHPGRGKMRRAKAVEDMANIQQGLQRALQHLVNGRVLVVNGREEPPVAPWTAHWTEERRQRHVEGD